MPSARPHALDHAQVESVGGRAVPRSTPTLYDLVPRYVRRLPGCTPTTLVVVHALIESCGSGFETSATRLQLASRSGMRGISPATITRAIAWLIASGVLESIPDPSVVAGRRLHLLWRRTPQGIRRIPPRRSETIQLELPLSADASAASNAELVTRDEGAAHPCVAPSANPTIERSAGASERDQRDHPVPWVSPSEPRPTTTRDDCAALPRTRTPDLDQGDLVAYWLKIAAHPGHPRARVAETMLKALRSPESDTEPPRRPIPRPEPPAAPAASYAPGNPTARCLAPDCTLDRALALVGRLGTPGVEDALLDALAKRWRDPKPYTRDEWRKYVRGLPGPLIAQLITQADGKGIQTPANYFSKAARRALREQSPTPTQEPRS